MKYVRMFADDEGESHFEDVEVGFSDLDYAPPPPPLEMSDFRKASQFVFMRMPPGWEGDTFHHSPTRQWAVIVSERVMGTTSDGETRVFEPRDVLLMEDTHGKGHGGNPMDGKAAVLAITRLAE
jgi:hypothetical protein